MARFEIVISRRRQAAGAPTARRFVVGGVGAVVARITAALLAVGVVVTALVLGYVIAGLVISAFLVAILVLLLRSVFLALRR